MTKEALTDIYASKEESNALIQSDTRTPEQKKADELADKNWMNEQGVESQRTWVDLTDEQIRQVMRSLGWTGEAPSDIEFARAIEAKLKEKNA